MNEELLEQIKKSVEWWGMAVASMPAADSLLAATTLSEEERTAALAMYHGNQWPPDVLAYRQANHRPALIVNRLPELVAAALDSQRRTSRAFSDADLPELEAVIAHLNADAQRLYNYALSQYVEMFGPVMR